MKEKDVFKTEFALMKEAKERAIYNEYNELMKQPGAMVSGVSQYLSEKHSYYRHGTIPVIVKRVEKRLKEEGKL